MRHPLRVVKVGGSLYDMPDLGARLREWLNRSPAFSALLVPGGGQLADAIRELDRIHRLGEEASHWLALGAMSVNAHMLSHLLPDMPLLFDLPSAVADGGSCILDPLPFFKEDERQPDPFPHQWQVTSDSLAVRIAVRAAAVELVLLKSVSWDTAGGWAGAAHVGIVDGYFEQALRRFPGLRVRLVNLRDTSAA